MEINGDYIFISLILCALGKESMREKTKSDCVHFSVDSGENAATAHNP